MKFLGRNDDYDSADIVILPIPLEDGVSWQKGCALAPQRILEASEHMEDYDFETGFSYEDVRVHVAPPVQDYGGIARRVDALREDGKFVIALGGDHSVSIPILTSLPEDVTIVHFDAHLDMRKEYEGSGRSHACALYEASRNHRVVHVGVRSGSVEDLLNAEKMGNLIRNDVLGIDGSVYITFDVDVLDLSLMPATGTPEPGGLTWADVNTKLSYLFRRASVVGMDIVEFMPLDGVRAYDYMMAKLVGRVIQWAVR